MNVKLTMGPSTGHVRYCQRPGTEVGCELNYYSNIKQVFRSCSAGERSAINKEPYCSGSHGKISISTSRIPHLDTLWPCFDLGRRHSRFKGLVS